MPAACKCNNVYGRLSPQPSMLEMRLGEEDDVESDYPVVFITWVGLPADSLESIGARSIGSLESIGSPTQVIMTTR